MSGQEALRSSITSELAARYRKVPEEVPYNIKVGPASLLFYTSVGVDYVDNIHASEIDRQDDFIFLPRFDTRLLWPLTERNILDISLGIGYSKYLSASENDSLLISPDSQLSFDVYVGDFRINFHDRFSYYQNPLQDPSVSGGTNRLANYGILGNTAGVSVDWDLNRLIISAGGDYVLNRSTSSDYSFVDYSAVYFYLRPAFLLSPMFTTGFDLAYGMTEFDENVNTDSRHYSVGPFLDWRLTEHVRVNLRGGYVEYHYDTPATPMPTGTNVTENSSVYGQVTLDHRVNQYLRHSLSGGSQLQQSVNANSLEFFYVRHLIYWTVFRGASLTTEFLYQHGKESGPIVLAQPETFQRFGGTISVGYPITRKLSSSLTYSYFVKDSNLPLRDYYQNRISLNFRYRF